MAFGTAFYAIISVITFGVALDAYYDNAGCKNLDTTAYNRRFVRPSVRPSSSVLPFAVSFLSSRILSNYWSDFNETS